MCICGVRSAGGPVIHWSESGSIVGDWSLERRINSMGWVLTG
jgi:hypothetical protein